METGSFPSAPNLALPANLPLLRIRLTIRLLETAPLPAYKGGLLRGGFGYAFKRSSCPQPCWNRDTCAVETLCPYRWVFETPHPPTITDLHDLRDVPRPFVIDPPSDRRTQYAAGDVVEFTLTLIGHGIDYLAYFLFGFEQLARMGLGVRRGRARLERAEALRPWQPIGQVIYQDGRALAGIADTTQAYAYDAATVARQAATLPSDLRMHLHTPLRVKHRGDWLRRIDPAALMQAACWRINALAVFHGGGLWPVDHRALAAQARTIAVEREQVRWEDWTRTSRHRETPRTMKLGGLMGSALLRGVPPDIRTVLLFGSLIHLGKACVFGHGAYRLEAEPVSNNAG
ncbi:MAG: CRISPR system precrRNA processing endoribonuclease RAMP protein Cas6 [Chloroflexales bacterium]|nr:CRISPR system precrRNA processing endoribonuclease RAMP protein Cas6 [Chloroflexales bacterium]